MFITTALRLLFGIMPGDQIKSLPVTIPRPAWVLGQLPPPPPPPDVVRNLERETTPQESAYAATSATHRLDLLRPDLAELIPLLSRLPANCTGARYIIWSRMVRDMETT